VLIVFGAPDGIVGWKAAERAAPPPDVLPRVRHFS
jgi:hypothetical protein